MAASVGKIAQGVARMAFAALFVAAGVMHFARTDMFARIIPPSFPGPRLLVWISGVCEVALGVMLLIPSTSRLAAWGLIALLVAVFPANIYLYQHQDLVEPHLPPVVHLLRLPFQAVLIFWAYAYTRKGRTAGPVPSHSTPT